MPAPEKLTVRAEMYKRTKQAEMSQLTLTPSKKLEYGVLLLLSIFVTLAALQGLYLIRTGNFNSEMWGGMLTIIGTVLGTFFGTKA